ncbi:putative carboxypeptidase S1 [Stipitochalara longipes BDJ]|nr:putative carboxypeptidase S1 [Stipitochalara longipes BDJ]
MFSEKAVLASLLFFTSAINATTVPRQIPAPAKGLKTILSPDGVQIRYKSPQICETTPGVNTYSGYIDLDPKTHMFFWFIEAREKPEEAPTTLWLTGGPGSDSLLAAFIENGPCSVTTSSLTEEYNPYSWSNYSNMLYLSQPIGTGFSYSDEGPGSLSNIGDYQPPSAAPVTGEWPIINASAIDTTSLAAVAAWHTIQAFFTNLDHLDSKIKSKSFNLFTESYGGRYGPVFFDYFLEQNQAISNGSSHGYQLNFETLGIGNGIIDYHTQAPYYPKFAVENTYGIASVNETVYNYMNFALNMEGGCLSQIDGCRSFDQTSFNGKVFCQEAQDMCRDNVEGPYYEYSGRGTYDIRVSNSADVPPVVPLISYLNQGAIQNALGVSLNWTAGNEEVESAFQKSGDIVFANSFKKLETLLGNNIRVVLYYGDADYICNWFGGEAVSLAVNYTHAAAFRAAGYAPFMIDGTEYGAVRERGNFSFVRIYDNGHQVPYFQPLAAQTLFQRSLLGRDIATGKVSVTSDYATNGTASATHTESFVPLPTGN